MKKILIKLTIALSLIIGFGINAKAEPALPQVTVSLTEEGKDIPEESPWGYRKPVAPILCNIDFNALSITTVRIPRVLSYELWDENGEAIIASYSNDYDMVSFLSSMTGVYQLRLVSAESSYIGFIEL